MKTKKTLFTFALSAILLNCVQAQHLDLQGHRGGMGLMPENTIASMINGIKVGVETLELDVVISKDGKVVVSHDGFMSSEFMLKPDGTDISKDEEKNLSLYHMPYDSIRRFDAGSKPHPRFAHQLKMKTYKPLLTDLIDSVESYVKEHGLKPVCYNIETKSSEKTDGFYNPVPEVFVRSLMDVINKKDIKKRLTIQSFDIKTLQILNKTEPSVKLSLLVGKPDLDSDLAKLGFIPDIYSPYYLFVTEELVKKTHERDMLILPWTVDEEKDMLSLANMKVDGIISNYPDKLVKLFGSFQTN